MSGNDASDEQEKIRLKRLARLGGPASSPAAGPSTPVAAETVPTRQAGPSSTSRLLSSTTPGPSATASPPPKRPAPQGQASSVPAGFSKKPTNSGLLSNANRLSDSPGPRVVVSSMSQTIPPSMPYDRWEADKIVRVFSVTLDKQEAVKSDHRLCWLKELSTDLAEEEPDRPRPLRTTLDLIDRLLIARLQIDPSVLASSSDPDQLAVLAGLPQNETVFEYLTGCWRRLYIANRETNRISYSAAERAEWSKAFDAIKTLLISYCGLTLEDPSMFPQPAGKPVGPQEFLPILLAQTSVSSGSSDPLTASASAPAPNLALASSDLIPFLNDLSARFGADSSELHGVIEPTISFLLQQWFMITPTPDVLSNEWRRYLGALNVLAQVKPIAALLPKMNIWVASGVTAEKIEWMSLLGPMSRLSVFPRDFPQVWKTFFSNPTDRKVGDIDANKANLRGTLGGLHDSLFNLFNAIVRAGPEAREGVLDYFALVATLNKKRSGSRVDPKTIATDGFMINLQVVLMRLFQPVMDVQFSKIDKVDVNYFKSTQRLSIEEETKIKGTKEEADAYFAKSSDAMEVDSPAAPNFISDLFFLANSYQYLGVIKTLSNRTRAEKNITDMEKELKRTEASAGDWAGNPALQAQGDAAIKKLKGDIATLHASIHAYDTQLQDPAFIQQVVAFLSFTMTWLVRLVDQIHQHPKVPIKLPLPAEAPLNFRMLPEYIIENVAEFFDFVSRYLPDALENMDKDILITFIIVFLTPGYINNPFLKAKFVGILANGTYPAGYYRKGFMYDRLNYHPLSTEYLMPTLVRFFIEVEATGGHAQFWDKFNMRRHMSRLFKIMWDNPLHREAFVKARHDNFDQFIKFINMLMSDTTFHLEESLTSLTKIHQTRGQIAKTEEWQARPEAERKDLQAALQQAESVAPFHTSMGRDHIELIEKFTATTKEPFLAPEIVERLAATLDENLVTLVGPKMQELKLHDAEAFSFKPKKLLAGISQIYINLGSSQEFIRAVANDGRSYSKSLFERFARVLKNRAIMVDAEVQALLAFCQKVEDTKATIEIEDEREIPDEFLDPLLATLMKDPVILPVSKQVIDRSTIRAALLSKEVDPFNNVPLKLEDCVPDIELKARIDAWVAEGKAKPADNVMDVDQA